MSITSSSSSRSRAILAASLGPRQLSQNEPFDSVGVILILSLGSCDNLGFCHIDVVFGGCDDLGFCHIDVVFGKYDDIDV